MRQAHHLGAAGVGRLVLGEPAQLANSESSQRHRPDGLRPRLPTAELLDEVSSGPSRSGVVPQQRGSHYRAGLVQTDHPVLLTTD